MARKSNAELYEENKKKSTNTKGGVTSDTSSRKSNRDLYLSSKAPSVISDFSKKYQNYLSTASSLIDTYKSRYYDEKENFVNDKYRSDSADYYESTRQTAQALQKERKELLDMLDIYGDYFNFEGSSVGEVRTNIARAYTESNNIFLNSVDDFRHWSQWETEEDYTKALAEAKAYQEEQYVLSTYDLDSLARNIKDLESVYSEVSELSERGNNAQDRAYYKTLATSKAQKRGYKSVEALRSDIEAMRERYNKAYVKQNTNRVDPNSEFYDPESKPWVEKGKAIENPSVGDATGAYILGLRFGDEEVQNPVTYTRDNYDKYTKENPSMNGGSLKASKLNDIYMEMTDEEANAYSALLAQDKVDGGNKAEVYRNAINETLEQRKAGKLSKPMTDEPALGLVFNFGYSAAKFGDDMLKLATNAEGEKSDPSTVDYMAQIIAEENDDAWGNAPGWIGKDDFGNNKTWYGVANDVTGTIGYMLPSILAAKLTGGASLALGASNAVAGTVGAVVGSGSMGLAAAGSGYQEMLDLGYNKEQARTYGLMIGAAEALTSYALSGISDVGGKLTGNAIAKVADKIDNAIGRFAVKHGGKIGSLTENFVRPIVRGGVNLAGSIGSEILEEEVQLWLEPAIKKAVLDIDFEAPTADEMLYTAIVTAFSTFFLEAGGTAKTEIDTKKKGKELKADGEVDRLVELGKTFSADTVAYQIASKVNKDTGAYTIGRLFNEVGASLSEANITDITNALVEKGFTQEQAETHAKWMNRVVEGGKLTSRQQMALEANDVLAEVLYGTIIQPNSTVMQRNQAVNQLHGIESSMGIDREALEKMQTPEAISQSVTQRLAAENAAAPRTRSGLSAEQISKIDDIAAKARTVIPEANYQDVGQASYKPSSAKIANTTDKVSDTGTTFVKSTGEEVSIKKIASIDAKNKTMKLELSNGTVVNSNDISYGDENQAALYESVLLMGYDVKTANAIVQGYANSPTSVSDYLIGTNEAFNYGWGHISEKARGGTGYKKLTQSERAYAVKLGEDARAADDNVREARVSQKQASVEKKKAKGGYGAKLSVDNKSVTDRVKKSVKALDSVAKALKLNIVIADLGGNSYGYYKRSTNELFVDVNAGGNGKHTLLFTASHELIHYVRNWSPDKFTVLADFLMEQYAAKGENIDALIRAEIDKAYKATRGKHEMTFDEAYEEVVAQAMQRFLTDSNFIERLASLQKKDANLAKRLVSKLKEILNSIRAAYQGMDTNDRASQAVKEMGEAVDELYAKMEEGLIAASEASQSIGTRNLEDFSEAKNTNGEDLFQYKAMEADEETYRQMLKKHGIMSETEINKLFSTVDKALVIIKNNLEVLDYAWEADIDDRSFSPVKPNSDNLYKVSLDFSTLCRKRILQQVIQAQLQDALNKPLSREESIAIRDELMKIQEEGRQIEIACALCYVESARMKSPAQIKKFLKNRDAVIKEFLASKAGGDIKQKIKQAEADARERLGVGNAPLKSMPGNIAEQIRDAKREAKKSYKPTAEEQRLIDAAASMTVTDFTSPEGLSNLAKNYPVLFDAYTSYIRNATKSKGIEKDTWWRAGDSDSIGDTLIANMNRENGLRSQSWSDFQVIHLLDYIAATIELSTRNAKEQAYSKVPDYIDLMGNTGVMLNMSLIPTAQFSGKLEYDSVEGMAYKKALELRDKYHATAGTICIGISNEQIKMLLDDSTIDYVIPYHKSGMAAHIRKLMHIPTWSEYEKYQNETELSRDEALKQAKKHGVTLLSESDPNYHKHTAFSEWFDIDEARQIAKQENAFPTDANLQKKHGVMYGGYMAMQNAANNYLKLCAERGLSPKFSHENANFTAEDNYWKLIIDRKMVDNVTGEVIEQQAINPIFDEAEVLRILNDELKRYPDVKADQDYATRTVVEKFLSGKMNDRLDADTVAAIMQKPVDNITTTNIVASTEQNTRLTDADLDEYMKVGKTQHTRNKKRRMLESGKKPILTSSEEIVSFMADVIHGKASGEVRAFAKAGGRLASAVQQVDGKLEVFGDYLELNADDLRESYKVHSSPKEKGDIPLSDADFQRIPEYLDDFDGVLLTNYYNGKKEVHLYKETEDGYIRILAVSSSERGSLLVTKLIGVSKEKFEEKYAKKIERNTGSPRGQTEKSDASNPLTEARLTAGVLSDVIVSQKPNSVKTNQKIASTLDTENLKAQYIDSDTSYAPTFYSQMGKVVEGVKQEKLAANSVVNMLRGKGVKAEEIRWSGIVPFLEGKKSVTKQELLDFVNGSMLQIGEQVSSNDIDLRYDTNTNSYSLHDKDGNVINTYTYSDFVGGYVSENDDEIYTYSTDLEDAVREEYGNMSSPRWADYKLDGGSNYREIIFTMPNSTYRNQMMKVHWGDEAEGVLAHARIQDFDVNGKKMLFVEEIQSDYHNEGHKDGYQDDATLKEIKDLEAKANEAFYALEDYSTVLTGLAGEYEAVAKTQKGRELLRAKFRAEKELKQVEATFDSKVPDAPFKDTYHEYVMKRLLRMAAENGYDSIGWTPAEIQDKRWDDNQYHDEGKGRSGNLIGYTIEYDQDIPKFLRKYGRQWGTKVGTTNLPNGTEVWSMDITDSMKNSVLYEGQVMYQYADEDAIDNRTILAKSLEGAAKTDIEKQKLKEYQSKINLINSEEKKLRELRSQIKEISFSKGTRDTEKLKSLRFEANQAANRINVYDKQLLKLEATKPLMDVLQREKELVRKKMDQKRKEAVKAAKQKDMETIRKLMNRHTESRKKAIEGRDKTLMRHKIKGIVNELDTLLRRPTAKKHIKEELRAEVADALLAINMDTVGADERVARYNEMIAKAKDPDIIEELVKSRDNIQLQGDNLKEKLTTLQKAYEKIKASDDVELSMSYQEVIRNSIANVSEKVGNTSIRNMSLEQLEMVYDLFSMIRTTIRNANKAFNEQKGQTIMQMAEAVNDQVRTVGGQRYKRNALVATLQRKGWHLLKPFVAFRTIGSVTLTNLYKKLRAGEDTFYGDVKEAQDFIEEQYEKFGYKSWDLKKTKSFTAKSGKTFDLTLEQMMTLYAYSKREQAHKHIIEGGIVFEDAMIVEKNKLGIPTKYEVTTKDAFNLSEDTFSEIANSLSAEQKAFVDAMQEYLSKTMGAKGNEVSMELLGVKLFKEEFYLPIKSSQEYMSFTAEEAGEVKLKSPAFSKETVPHANNPIVLHNFTDLWAEHINDMSMYHSFVLALEDFTRVYNYKTKTGANLETMSTKAALDTAFPGATKYINKFLKDMNGGIRAETVGWAEKLTSLAKKGSVLGSLSVAIQQPSAVMRAMSFVNPTHFVATTAKSFNLVKHKQDWAELKKYAPIAGIKEMGRFDVGISQGTVDWIKSNKTLMNKGEDFLSALPAFMDEITWVSIWNAVKRETLRKHNNLSPKTEEFLKIAGERFTEVISLSQVYDSVFARSDIMRNKSWIAKTTTAFMAEPMTTLNMAVDAFVQGKRAGTVKGFMKAAAPTAGAIVAAYVLNSALKSIVTAARDDDEDESYIEKYLEHFVGDLKDSLNPLTLVPIAKDIVSIFQGYDVERMDMSLVSDLYKAIEAFDSDNKTVYEKWSGLIGATSAFFGIPVKNVERDVRAVINTFFGERESTTKQGLLDAISKGWTSETESNGKQLYEAILDGDAKHIERVEGRFKNEDAIETAIRKALRENDPRIKKAAKELISGNVTGFGRYVKTIASEGNFDEEMVEGAIRSEKSYFDNKISKAYEAKTDGDEEEYKKIVRELRNSYRGIYSQDEIVNFIKTYEPDADETSDEEEETSIYKASDVNTALENGDISSALEVIDDMVKVKTNNYIAEGKSKKEAEKSAKSSIRSSLTSYWKPLYLAAYKSKNNAEMARIRKLLNSTKVYDNVVETCQDWVKQSKKTK